MPRRPTRISYITKTIKVAAPLHRRKARRNNKPRNPAGSQTPLKRALERCGGQAEVARQLGITQQSVFGWVERNRVPASRVGWLSAKSGVKRSLLRPDLYWEGE